ncbi:hypothetical protein OROHE_014578 [Orobanche hederae]
MRTANILGEYQFRVLSDDSQAVLEYTWTANSPTGSIHTVRPVRHKVSLFLILSVAAVFAKGPKDMWRRVASLSQLVSSSKSRLLDQVQVACGINAWQMITTQVLNQGVQAVEKGLNVQGLSKPLGLLT